MSSSQEPLNKRGIARGVQCVCGQWWPDFQRHEGNQFITECCGSVYHYQVSLNDNSTFATLSLGHHLKPTAEHNL